MMRNKNSNWKLFGIAALMLVVLACSVSLNNDEEVSSAEQTLQAIYLERTQTAEASMDTSAESEGPPAVEIEHTTLPGNPGKADQIKDEIDTENTAGSKSALGDSFRLGNFERPFTETVMDYHPETDIVRLLLSRGSDFYYFTFELNGADKDLNYPSATYGIEIDTDYDGRGDYLLWAKGDSNTEWNIDDVMLLADSNEDVGGASAVVPDNNDGNGYDQVLFSINDLNDPDSAWKRVDPTDGNNIQLAVKIGLIDNNRFYWKAWADAGVADPAMFDYNDSFSESQAGSPNKNSSFYPISGLNLMDSTCWIAYNLTPTGTELGGCVGLQPTQQPPPPTLKPGCNCSTYVGLDQNCCIQCGFAWSSQSGVCYVPPK
ncbi:MAG: hypothetical protein Q7J07_05285 [Pelolinea sp.]|nr:hypothetical protein [Pelolinea sp.]